MTLLEMKGITKRFDGVIANDGISLSVNRGEIHALMGENGAGKSTLMNILYGLLKPDAGEILVDGKAMDFTSPLGAIAAGIGMVHQTFRQFPNLTVWENLVFQNEPRQGPFVSADAARDFVRRLGSRHGLEIDPDSLVRDLAVGIRQRLEILKALSREARILILDEPTAVLTPQERDGLFSAMRELAGKGMALILVTHKIPEVIAITDKITVMRDGRVSGTLVTRGTNEAEIIRAMVGRNVPPTVASRVTSDARPMLSVKDLSVRKGAVTVVDDVSFDVRPGEIVGIAGVSGNGQPQLISAVMGLEPATGVVSIDGQDISRLPIARRRSAGISYVPEDRHLTGTAPAASIAENIVFGTHRNAAASSKGFLRKDAIRAQARKLIERFRVKAASEQLPIGSLSGGNMQKVVIAREVEHGSPLIIVEEPTRGVDVGAIEFIHQTLIAERDKGRAILVVSSDLTELLALSDRILVMFEGRINASLTGSDMNEDTVGRWMMGGAENR
ncbi:heme ABC transporter ATP-binding protein [Mesorhizobium loti]|nr:ABC transporter ATP-binding protein [Mesorhizobium loti]PLP59744.1 heme ABC transporter ATP-binding protein [Mesorhizobium loti]